MASNGTWAPSSWKAKPVCQMAEWEDKVVAEKVLKKLSCLPPLVQSVEVDRLRIQLAEAGRGERFIVQGGDCAERFIDCEQDRLEKQIKLMLQLGMVTKSIMGIDPLVICRIAGQYGKPRSKPTEIVEGVGEVMSFKGDNINGFEVKDRKWDPERLLQGYFHSAATLNFLRSYVQSASPEILAAINVGALTGAKELESIRTVAAEVLTKSMSGAQTEFYTSHEAMQLDLEESLTRKVGDKYYNLGAHLIWIGDRTRQLDGGHMEYFKGVSNPIGVKVGPSMKNAELTELVQILNPDKQEGRLLLITRYGAAKIEEFLPGHIEAVKASGVPVVWQCDACHGNGIVAKSNKFKTRDTADILSEISKCMAVHKKCGSVLGGIHLEMTGQEGVTECLGGCVGLTEKGLEANYETYCDPRLNYAQAVEMVHKVALESGEGPAAKRAKTA